MEAIRVQSVGKKMKVEIMARGHRLVADEPKESGDDEGPTPYELLLAALGS